MLWTLTKVVLTLLMSTLMGWLAYNTATYGSSIDFSSLVVGGVSYVLILFFVLSKE